MFICIYLVIKLTKEIKDFCNEDIKDLYGRRYLKVDRASVPMGWQD